MKNVFKIFATAVFSIFVFTVFFMTSAFAETVSSEEYVEQPRQDDRESFRHNGFVYAPMSAFNPSCNVSREMIDTQIGITLRRHKLKDTGFDVIDLAQTYGMKNEEVVAFYKEVAAKFGVDVSPLAAKEIPTTYHLNEYIYRESFKLCPDPVHE